MGGLAERRRQLINALLDCSYDEHDALWSELQNLDSRMVGGDAAEPPLLSEQIDIAGADHAPSSAARDGSAAPETIP